MCDLRQDTCLFGHGRVDRDLARNQVSPGVFGAFLHCDKCDKNRHRHLVPHKRVPLLLGVPSQTGTPFIVTRNSRSQTGTPGASRTQSVAGGHRPSALHTVGRVPLVAPLPASPAVPSRVQLSSAEMVWVRRGGGHSSPCSSPSC